MIVYSVLNQDAKRWWYNIKLRREGRTEEARKRERDSIRDDVLRLRSAQNGGGFGLVGPVDNYAHIPFLGKWLLIWCMLLGRLEIFTVIILVVPEFYRK